MWVLGKGRKPYLELLRNLSIQFLLAGFFILVSRKAVRAFDGDRISDGLSLVFIALVLFIILALAMIANLKSFFTEFSEHATKKFDDHRASLSNLTAWGRYKSCARFLLTKCKLAVIESIFLVLGIYMASAVGLLAAVDSVSSTFVTHKEPEIFCSLNPPQIKPVKLSEDGD